MIRTLKQDSKRYESDAQSPGGMGLPDKYRQEVQATRSPNSSPGMPYGSSATFNDRERMGRSNIPQPGYSGYPMDTTMDNNDEERPPARGYREQEPIMDARMDTRQDPRQDLRRDPRQDPRQQLPTSRHTQVP